LIDTLIVVAHPDDEILGCGASGTVLTTFKKKVQPIILCGEVNARTQRPSSEDLFVDIKKANLTAGFSEPVMGNFPNISMNTVPHIEIVQFIEKQIEKFQPLKVFTHHPGDLNDDHVQVSKACQVAVRLFQRRLDLRPINELYFMEILSSTEWSFETGSNAFQPNTFIEIGEDGLNKKIKALKCYRRVIRDFPHPRSIKVLRSLAAYRGAQANYNYAEAFQLVFKRGI